MSCPTCPHCKAPTKESTDPIPVRFTCGTVAYPIGPVVEVEDVTMRGYQCFEATKAGSLAAERRAVRKLIDAAALVMTMAARRLEAR